MNISRLLLGCTAACSMLLMSCDDAKYDVLENQAYIAQTNTNGNTAKKITVGNDDVSTELNVRMSSPAAKTSDFSISVDEDALKSYNKINSTAYEVLPTSQYKLSATDVTVAEGEAASTPVDITISPFSEELKASGKKFALPLKITSKDGANVLPSGSSIIYVLDQVIYQAVPTINRNNKGTAKFPNEVDAANWTFETNIKMKKMGTAVGEWNNQAIFDSDDMYIRFGDAPIEGNRLQIKTHGTQMNSKMLFNDDTWYHIAFVCTGSKLYLYVNGVLDNSMDLGGGSSKITYATLIPSPDWTHTDITYSECRIWTVARSQAQIAGNMYVTDPNTDGLLAYWKMNEGEGNTFKDATKTGADFTVTGTVTWTPNVRIDGK